MWCITKGLRSRDRAIYAAARRQLVFKNFAALGKLYPPARTALEQERERMEQALLGGKDDANLARDIDALNCSLAQHPRSLELYDRLPATARARCVLFDKVIDLLIAHRRYAEVLKLVDPETAFQQEAIMARRQRALWDESPDARSQRGQWAFAVARGAMLVEALAATGRVAEAKTLADAILRFSQRQYARDVLLHHARRAGVPELTAHIEARFREYGPTESPTHP